MQNTATAMSGSVAAIPLSTEGVDSKRVLRPAYQRVPHPAYGNARIPAL